VFVTLGQTRDAINEFERAAALDPRNAKAFFNLGKAYLSLNQPDDAIKALREALTIDPDYASAHHMMGLSLLWDEQPDAALSEFRSSADLTRNHGQRVELDEVYPSRVKHDSDQIRYLAKHGYWKEERREYVETLHALKERAEQSIVDNEPVSLSEEEAAKLAPSFNRILHYADNRALPNGVLNPELDVEDIERRYNSSQPEIIHIDDLFREEALRALQQFCLESTIWKTNYADGYVGAFLSEGFSSPLLLQAAEELRTTFPGIFHDHRLTQAWAFKQDSRLRGVQLHADAAAVNVNLWITKDRANLDPSSGGLTVWDKEAPREWDFELYNSAKYKPKILEYLKETGAAPVTVPYRENRALIFNSDLFHQTDDCHFRDEYESRRINITFLYGNRV
jgi:tetratricopeptide (TPR) repeat protein